MCSSQGRQFPTQRASRLAFGVTRPETRHSRQVRRVQLSVHIRTGNRSGTMTIVGLFLWEAGLA
jgi:hypothetical protein